MQTLLIAALLAATETVEISHLPPGDAPAGEPLAITAQVTNAYRLASFELHVRHRGDGWKTIAFGTDGRGGWAAIVDAADMRPPSIEYYVTAQEKEAQAVDRFASEKAPHPVIVHQSQGDHERDDRLLKHAGHTSSAMAFGEYVNFGTHPGLVDQYWQGEASYEYRLLDFVQHIRLGMGVISGEVPPPAAFEEGFSGTAVSREAGLKYGFGELAFNLTPTLGATGKLLLGADALGFATGAAGMLRIGEETAAHAELGGQVMQRYGFDAYLRFAWDTVPRWPMGFAVHLTDMPKGAVLPNATPDHPVTDQGAPTGIRAIYDVGFRATDNVTLLVKAGYQARYSLGGGAAVGGGVQVEW
jgi:hypothetical protein